MNVSLSYYVLIGALVLTMVCGVILYSRMLAWRRRCRSRIVDFTRRESALRDEMEGLRTRVDEMGRENSDMVEELSALRREIDDSKEATGGQMPADKKLEVIAQMKHGDEEVQPGESSLHARFIKVVEGQIGNSSLQIDAIGRQLNLSRVQLYRRLKAETGMTPNELLRAYRLAKAASLLTTTNLTIAEIAYRVGYSSPGYFSRCFREQYGTLPQDLRTTTTRKD